MIEVNNPDHGRTIAKAAGALFFEGVNTVISRSKDGFLLGGSIFTNYTGASIGMHTAAFAPRWISPNLLWATFSYPFEQLECRKVFGQVQASNYNAMKFDLGLGFKIEAVIKDVFPDGDMNVMSMLKEDCRWLKIKPRNFNWSE